MKMLDYHLENDMLSIPEVSEKFKSDAYLNHCSDKKCLIFIIEELTKYYS